MFRRFIVRILKAFAPTYEGGVVGGEHGSWEINDGINYQVPFAIPSWLKEVEGGEAQFLKEVNKVFDHQFGKPYVNLGPISPIVVDPLVEWDISTRRTVLEQCHLTWERNPIANAGITFTRLFTVQDGMRVSYRNKEVQEVIEKFINHEENAIKEAEKSILETLLVDGEIFIRFFEGDGTAGAEGEVVIASMVPWGVHFIEHEPGFVRRVNSYHYITSQDNGVSQVETVNEQVPADEVLHVAINRLWYEQRGRPELFKVLPWLGAYREWLENRARQNFWRGAILWWVKLLNATAGQVRAKLTQYREPIKPGSMAVTNDNEEWTQFSPNVGANDAGEDGRMLKLMIAAGLRLPEYFLSDGSNANLASATAQQLPALRSFGEFQDVMSEQVFVPMFKRVIQVNIDAGILTEEVIEEDSAGDPIKGADMILAVDAFDVRYPPLEADDPKTLAEVLSIAVNMDWISNETAAAHMPLDIDWPVEQKRIDEERQKRMGDIAKGLIPRDPPPFGPDGSQPADEPEEEPEEVAA